MNLPESPPDPARSQDDWPARQREWQRRLPRLRLEAEPIEEQLGRYRRATIALSVVTVLIAGTMFLLFAAFRAPLIGLTVSFALAGAVVGAAWRAHRRLRRGAERYLLERQAASAGQPAQSTKSGEIP